VLDPALLTYVALLHFEGDECGGMSRFMDEAPQAQLVASALLAGLNLARFPWRYRVLDVCDGDTIELGRRSLRVLETPHVHHWDSMMLVEETSRSLFPSERRLKLTRHVTRC
jgi:flavorubredoxin